MPWTADYAADSAELHFFGTTKGEEILEAKAQFFSHPFATEPRYVLCDFSAVEKFAGSPYRPST